MSNGLIAAGGMVSRQEKQAIKKPLIFAAILALIVVDPVFAGKWHAATKPTQEQAMQAATDRAIARAIRKDTCYKPSWTREVMRSKPCKKVLGGVKCWATSADRYGSCNNGKAGWLTPDYPGRNWSFGPIPIYPNLPSLPRPAEPKPCNSEIGKPC